MGQPNREWGWICGWNTAGELCEKCGTVEHTPHLTCATCGKHAHGRDCVGWPSDGETVLCPDCPRVGSLLNPYAVGLKPPQRS